MDTGGWDVVFALSMDNVNAALAQATNGLPQQFSASGTDFLPYDVEGTFGTWQIIPGGSGPLLWLQIDIAGGTAQVGSGSTLEQAPLTGVAIQCELALKLIPAAGGQDLVFDVDALAPKDAPPAPGLVKPLGVTGPGSANLPEEIKDSLADILCGWLVANPGLVAHVFASINPADSTEGWLAPAQSAYCYYAQQAGPAWLVILSVVAGHSMSGLNAAVDPSLFRNAPAACVMIAGPLILQNVIQPLLPAAFGHGASASSFTYDSGAGLIRNTGDLATDGVTKGAITYYPTITALAMGLAGSALTTSVSGNCDLKLNIEMTFSISTANASAFNAGDKSIAFQRDPNPQQHHDASIPWYDFFLGPIPDLIMAIVIPVIADGIADSLSGEMESFSLARTPPQSVSWSGLGGLTVSNAWLDGALVLEGSYQPAPSVDTLQPSQRETSHV